MTEPSPTGFPRPLSLFEAIQAGEPGWQKRVYEQFFPLVRRLLVKSLGPTAEIEDLLRDTFLSFFENAKNVRSADGMSGYIVSITMNLARREIRRERRRRLLYFWEDAEGAIERTPNSDDPKAKAALMQLHRILEELKVDERMVYVLHHLEGKSLEEVAVCLGMSLSTTKRRMALANEKVLRRVKKNPLLSDYVREKGGESRE